MPPKYSFIFKRLFTFGENQLPMKSNLPLIIFLLFFGATFVAFLVFSRKGSDEDVKNDPPNEEVEPTEVEEGS